MARCSVHRCRQSAVPRYRDSGAFQYVLVPTISLVKPITDDTQSTTRLRPSDFLSLESLAVPTYMGTTTTLADGTVLIPTTGPSPISERISGSFILSRVRTHLTPSSNFKAERSILGADPALRAVQLSSTQSSHESSTRTTSETVSPSSTST
jgi:hypothetical protein